MAMSLGRILQPCGDVDGVTYDCELNTRLVADKAAVDLARVDADSQADRLLEAALVVPAVDPVGKVGGEGESTSSIVRIRLRYPKHHQGTVPHKLVYNAAVGARALRDPPPEG